MKHTFTAFCVAMALTLGLLSAQVVQAADGEMRLAGATTLAKFITAKQADIEAKAGVKLAIVGNGAGRGMAAFCAGQADMAMLGGPIKGVIDEFNSKNADAIKEADFKVADIVASPGNVMVHPSNTVASLTMEQFQGIFSGKIANWKEVGGADTAIVVVLPPAGDGFRAAVQYDYLKGEKLTKEAKTVQLAPDVCKIVAQVPGAISFASAQNTAADVKAVKTEKPLEFKLSLVTKGEPSAAQKKVIDAVKEALAK